MNAKTYLNQLRSLEAAISSRKAQLDRLRQERTYLSAVSYDRDRVQASANGDVMKGSDKLIDLELEIGQKVAESVQVREQIIGQVQRLENPQYVILLLHRYVDGMRFERIAVEMNYSYERIRHMHGEALQAFENLFQNGVKS